jgi:hypothetical protein
VDLFGTKLRVSANIGFDAVSAGPEEMRIEIRVGDLKVVAPPGSPAAQMISAMDLKRPGSLMGFMPRRPAVLVEARDDRFVFDLLKVPALAKNKALRKALTVLSDVLSIKEVTTNGDVLVISFGVRPTAVPGALLKLRGI